jgi:hypothetical protein
MDSHQVALPEQAASSRGDVSPRLPLRGPLVHTQSPPWVFARFSQKGQKNPIDRTVPLVDDDT